jgi:type III secretion protein R
LAPLRAFLVRNCDPVNLDFFMASTRRLWPEEVAASVSRTDLMVVLPAFVVTELTAAFQIGFLLYLPFAVIDLIVQSILLALGMMMMSPMTLALPLKLLLFVLIEGWTKLISSLVLSYA